MNEKKNKTSSLLSLVLSIVQTIVMVVVLAVVITSFSAKLPFLANNGLTFYNIVSGSMEPKIPTGSLIYSGKFKVEDLKEGDIITFQIKQDENSKPVVVTHRITHVQKDEKTDKLPDGKEKKTYTYLFTTKGDANNKEDSLPVPTANILGKYQWHLPYMGYVSSFVQQPLGFGLLVLLPSVILIVWEISSLILHFKHHYENKNNAEVERLKKALAEKENVQNA